MSETIEFYDAKREYLDKDISLWPHLKFNQKGWDDYIVFGFWLFLVHLKGECLSRSSELFLKKIMCKSS